jgi:hypothetical protein
MKKLILTLMLVLTTVPALAATSHRRTILNIIAMRSLFPSVIGTRKANGAIPTGFRATTQVLWSGRLRRRLTGGQDQGAALGLAPRGNSAGSAARSSELSAAQLPKSVAAPT